MKVPLLDLGAEYRSIESEIRAAIDGVLKSQRFILGPEVEELEREVAELCGVGFGVGVSSGTDALLVALMALDVGPGDEVITTAYSFFATAGVITRLGARPVFVDIEPHTFNVDTSQAVAAISKRTRAIIPVHLFGRSADMDPLLNAASIRGFAVVEDAAQAIAAFDEQGRTAGGIGDIGCFSFYPTKNLGGAGDGGMVVATDERLAERIRRLRVHGSRDKYHHAEVGGNFRLDALQAAVLRVKLRHLGEWTAARRRNAERYRELFADAGLTETVTTPQNTPGHVYNQFVIRAPGRDELRTHLSTRGVGTEVYYPIPLHRQECFRELGYADGDLPHSEAAARETLALPIYPALSIEQQRHVVSAIAAFYTG